MPSVVMNDGTRRNVVITPLVSPTDARDEEREDDSQPERKVVLLGIAEPPHERRGEGEDPPHCEVDLAADEQHHLAGRDQRDRGHRLGDVLDVVALQEDAVLRLEEERERHGDDEDARLAAA